MTTRALTTRFPTRRLRPHSQRDDNTKIVASLALSSPTFAFALASPSLPATLTHDAMAAMTTISLPFVLALASPHACIYLRPRPCARPRYDRAITLSSSSSSSPCPRFASLLALPFKSPTPGYTCVHGYQPATGTSTGRGRDTIPVVFPISFRSQLPHSTHHFPILSCVFGVRMRDGSPCVGEAGKTQHAL